MPHRPPLQARSRRTLERILQATVELIEERGLSALAIGDIVERARSSVGSFYARFSSKDDLLDFVRVRMWSDATERWRNNRDSGAWDTLDLETLIPGVIRLFYQAEGLHLRAREALGGAENDDVAAAFRREVQQGAQELLMARKSQITHPDPDRAGEFAVRFALAVVRDLRRRGVPADPEVIEAVDADLAELGSAISAYLMGRKDGTSGEAVDFFDIWG